MGWIVLYVLFIPLIGGAAWIILQSVKDKNARSRETEGIQRRIAEKEVEAQQANVVT